MKKAIELNDNQKRAVSHKSGPLLIIAGAGSGKTRTLTSRLARLIKDGTPPESIVAITFTNKAAGEMRRRSAVGKEGTETENRRQFFGSRTPFIGTFHSFGASILRREAKIFNRTPRFTIFDDNDSSKLIRDIVKELNIPKEKKAPFLFRKEISKIKNELRLNFERYDSDTREVFTRYEKALALNNAFDFDDLIEKVVYLFRDHPEILKKYQRRFQNILVDEFQDVNTAQYELVKFLAQDHKNISVVGDDAQSIYSFRNADFRNFLNFEHDWPEATVITLDQNYCSSQTILDAATAVINNNKIQKRKRLWTEVAGNQPINIVRAADAAQEAEVVADHIAAINPEKRSLIAVLYRTNAQSRAIETELITREIPYRIFGGVKFYERKEVKDIIAGLRLIYNPRDIISRERLPKAFGKRKAAVLTGKLSAAEENLSPLELINIFLKSSDYFNYLKSKFPNAKERRDNVNELIDFAGTFTDLGSFLERVALLQSTDRPTGAPKTDPRNIVNLMTIHLAKGLEFETVFLIGCSEGLLPHQLSYGTPAELEEERRLMYVAMTRAKQNLFLSFFHFPSRFIYEIPAPLTIFTDRNDNQTTLPDEDEIYIE